MSSGGTDERNEKVNEISTSVLQLHKCHCVNLRSRILDSSLQVFSFRSTPVMANQHNLAQRVRFYVSEAT